MMEMRKDMYLHVCIFVVVIILQSTISNAGQQCLSCSSVESAQSCQHHILCSNTEVCYKHKYVTESGGINYDFGCAQPEVMFWQKGLTLTIDCQKCVFHLNFIPHMKDTNLPRECSDIDFKNHADGVYTIYPDGRQGVPVYCDMTTEHFRWTIIQRRINGFVDFYRGWSAYKEGFGNVSGEYWLGNNNIHEITSHSNHDLRIELEDFDGNMRYAEYTTYSVGDEGSSYRLLVSNYSGNAGDSLGAHNGMKFTTFDRDNVPHKVYNCAVQFKGAWWYHSGCHHSNLNGKYLSGHHTTVGDGINWSGWKGFFYSLKSTKMMIRKY